MKKKLLLHVCCANCATVPIEYLVKKYNITLFWYNPNIHPVKEYNKRLFDFQKLGKIYNIDCVEIKNNTENWFNAVKGFENEPEGEKRCDICIKIRIKKACEYAKKNNFSYLATTLTIGPQKKAQKINSIAQDICEKKGISFYTADFKKQHGFQKSIELSKKHGFYRQQYCGCVFSIKK